MLYVQISSKLYNQQSRQTPLPKPRMKCKFVLLIIDCISSLIHFDLLKVALQRICCKILAVVI